MLVVWVDDKGMWLFKWGWLNGLVDELFGQCYFDGVVFLV